MTTFTKNFNYIESLFGHLAAARED